MVGNDRRHRAGAARWLRNIAVSPGFWVVIAGIACIGLLRLLDGSAPVVLSQADHPKPDAALIAVLGDGLDAMLELDLALTLGICVATGYLLRADGRHGSDRWIRGRAAGVVVFVAAFVSQALAVRARLHFHKQVVNDAVVLDDVQWLLMVHVTFLAVAAFGLLYVALATSFRRQGPAGG